MNRSRRNGMQYFFGKLQPELLETEHIAEDKRLQLFLRLYIVIIACTLPGTAGVLWFLTIGIAPVHARDIHGLIAVSTGILGFLVFYIFLYKYQTTARLSFRRRLFFLLLHAFATLVLFVVVIWLGFASPWSMTPYWGSYDLNTAARSWVIALIVVGAITLLGSFFDLVRRTTGR